MSAVGPAGIKIVINHPADVENCLEFITASVQDACITRESRSRQERRDAIELEVRTKVLNDVASKRWSRSDTDTDREISRALEEAYSPFRDEPTLEELIAQVTCSTKTIDITVDGQAAHQISEATIIGPNQGVLSDPQELSNEAIIGYVKYLASLRGSNSFLETSRLAEIESDVTDKESSHSKVTIVFHKYLSVMATAAPESTEIPVVINYPDDVLSCLEYMNRELKREYVADLRSRFGICLEEPAQGADGGTTMKSLHSVDDRSAKQAMEMARTDVSPGPGYTYETKRGMIGGKTVDKVIEATFHGPMGKGSLSDPMRFCKEVVKSYGNFREMCMTNGSNRFVEILNMHVPALPGGSYPERTRVTVVFREACTLEATANLSVVTASSIDDEEEPYSTGDEEEPCSSEVTANLRVVKADSSDEEFWAHAYDSTGDVEEPYSLVATAGTRTSFPDVSDLSDDESVGGAF